jgi:phage terminase large subunit GpA-like protein
MQTSLTHYPQFASIVRPPARLKVSEWAEQFAVLPHEGNEEPGKYHLARMPHQAAMLDDPLDPSVSEIFWMLASQFTGKTACLTIQCLYAAQALKRSMVMVRSTGDTAKEWMREKFIPMLEETPCMAGLFKNPRVRDSGSTSLNRRFPGGSLKAIGAKSAMRLRGGSAGIVFQDEIDSYETLKREGDPCALADRAAKTFSRAWKIKSSTPTLKGFSRIDSGYESGDKQKYFIPCPVCGEFQDLKFSQLKFSFTAEEHARFTIYETKTNDSRAIHTTRCGEVLHAAPSEAKVSAGQRGETEGRCITSCFTWETGSHPIRDTKRALYVCEHCHHGWTDAQRIAAYKSGHKDNPAVTVNGKELRAEWRGTAPFKGIRSRHLNGMYGTIGLKDAYTSYLHWFAEDFLAAKRDGRETLMVWTNLFLAEAFEDESEKTDWKTLRDRGEDYVAWEELPAQVVWINWAMDIHPDRVEILFYGWGSKRECWALEKHVEYCDFDLQSAQDLVWAYLDGKKFSHPILGQLTWAVGMVDAGYQTKVQAVYQFAGKHRWRNVFSTKGFDTIQGETVIVKKERRFGGSKVNINTDYFKTTIYDRLQNTEPGPSYVHFPKAEAVITTKDGQRTTFKTGFTDRFYQQMCSERRIRVKLRLGGYKTEWHKLTSATRNEVLDCTVGCFAGWEVAGVERNGDIERKWKTVEKALAAMHPKPTAQEAAAAITLPAEIKKPELRTATQHRPARRMVINSPFRFRRF